MTEQYRHLSSDQRVALDLFCKAGGASMGLSRAGYRVIGVDIEPQPHYPFEFVQANALKPPFDLSRFDLIWASPPCQAYTGMQRINTRAPKRVHPKLVEPVRAMLQAAGRPYIIENVPGAPLIDPIILCGSMFGLGIWRHRLFECSFWTLRPQCRHDLTPKPIAVYGDHPQTPGDKTMRVNRARNLAEGQRAMGIDWMPWRALTQAIPPAFSEFLGRAVLS
jgi:DNA (cytosine-5)-methyltransferase 1